MYGAVLVAGSSMGSRVGGGGAGGVVKGRVDLEQEGTHWARNQFMIHRVG